LVWRWRSSAARCCGVKNSLPSGSVCAHAGLCTQASTSRRAGWKRFILGSSNDEW
jgi:hypothetical protein